MWLCDSQTETAFKIAVFTQVTLPDTDTPLGCERCGLPVCGECNLQRSHHSLECDLIMRLGTWRHPDQLPALLEGLTTARLMLIR